MFHGNVLQSMRIPLSLYLRGQVGTLGAYRQPAPQQRVLHRVWTAVQLWHAVDRPTRISINSPTELTCMLPTDCNGSPGCVWWLLMLRRKKDKCGWLPQAATTQCLFTAMLLMPGAAGLGADPASAASAMLPPAATAVVLIMAPVSGLTHTTEPSLHPTYTPCGQTTSRV